MALKDVKEQISKSDLTAKEKEEVLSRLYLVTAPKNRKDISYNGKAKTLGEIFNFSKTEDPNYWLSINKKLTGKRRRSNIY